MTDRPNATAGEEALWCMHIQGPDDLHAAPDFWTALAWAAELNAFLAKKAAEGKWAADGNYPLTQASVRRWTGTRESHAVHVQIELADRAEHEAKRKEAAALSAPSPAAGTTGVVPVGWKLVPEEPTPEMLAAGYAAYAAAEWELGRAKRGPERESLPVLARAMLAAAPEVPTPVTSAPGAEGVNKPDNRKEVMPNDTKSEDPRQSDDGRSFSHVTSPGSECGARRGAPGAEGGEDLAGLSARATPGLLNYGNSPRAEQSKTGVEIFRCDGGRGQFGVPFETACANARFLRRLWNDYRSGRLTPAAPTPAPVAQGEPVAWLRDLSDELDRLGREATDREAMANAEARQTDADFCAGEANAYHEAAALFFRAFEHPAPAAPRSADLPGREEIAEIARGIREHVATRHQVSSRDQALHHSASLGSFIRQHADTLLALLTPPSPTQEMRAAGGFTQAAQDVLAERRRQVEAEGWTPAHDDEHNRCEMAIAAACYITAKSPVRIEREWVYPDTPRDWPWHHTWWKPSFYRRNLVKGCALILAEIERWDRAAGGEDRGGE